MGNKLAILGFIMLIAGLFGMIGGLFYEQVINDGETVVYRCEFSMTKSECKRGLALELGMYSILTFLVGFFMFVLNYKGGNSE